MVEEKTLKPPVDGVTPSCTRRLRPFCKPPESLSNATAKPIWLQAKLCETTVDPDGASDATLLDGEPRVKRRSSDYAPHVAKPGSLKQSAIFAERALFSLRTQQHVQGLHERRYGAVPILRQKFFNDQQAAAFRQT